MVDRSESSSALSPEDARIDQIADAALRLFARYGYKRSSMDDIAKEAGLAKATLYLHFKGKDDVFRAMLNLLARRVEARCREVVAVPGPFRSGSPPLSRPIMDWPMRASAQGSISSS